MALVLALFLCLCFSFPYLNDIAASTTIFQMIQSKVFLSDCVTFFDAITTSIQNIAAWIILSGKEAAQIGNGISNLVIAGIVYWLIRILICGGCLAVAGILVAIIGIKVAGLHKKYCWDIITIIRNVLQHVNVQRKI